MDNKTEVMTTAEEVKEHASSIELYSINFKDKRGKIARNYGTTVTVEIEFIDGQKAVLNSDEFNKLSDVSFKLRPLKNDS